MRQAVSGGIVGFCLGVALLLAGCQTRETAYYLGGKSEVRIAVASGPMNFDPHLNSEEITNTIGYYLFEPLVFLDDNLKVIPCVAESWQNPDPVTWLFEIRPGITFHDGSPLTVQDVVFSIERLRGLPTSPKKPFVLSVKSVRAVGDNQVEIVTHEPYMPLLIKLSQIFIVPAHYYRQHSMDFLRSHPVGSGPYRLAGGDLQKEIVLQAVPGHWRFPKLFQIVRFLVVEDERLRSQALETGRADFIKEPSTDDLDRLRQSPRFQVVVSSGIRLIFLGLSYAEKLRDGTPNPFRDKEIRRALAIGVNRQELVQRSFAGMAEPAWQLVSTLVFGYAPGVSAPGFDPGVAREVLATRSFPSGRTFPLYYPAGKYFRIRQTAETISRQMAALGVKFQPAPMPTTPFLAALERQECDVFLCGWLAITGDTSDFFENSFHSREGLTGYGFFNPVGYLNTDTDRLIESSTRFADRSKRLAILQQIMSRCMDEEIWIPLVFLKDSYAFRRDLKWRPRFDRYVFAYQMRPAEQ